MVGESNSQTSDAPPIRLLLSGGGHRATVGSLGAVAYLAHSEDWPAVDEVVSVSGGSIANAALASAGADEDVWRVLATALSRIDQDCGRVWANARRLLVFVRYFAVLIAVALVVGIALGAGPAVPPMVSMLVGVLAIPALARTGGLCANALTRDFISMLSGRSEQPLVSDPNRVRAHVFCASGLSSGVPYLLWTGRPFAEDEGPSWGTTLQSPYSIVDAALASVSLPFLGRIRSPRNADNTDALAGGEILVDGGVSGIFGEQVATPFRRTPADTDRSDERRTIAIDAGRHISSPSRIVRTLERFSVSATLLRWLKASLEATYVNDLVDLAPETLVRICESDDVLSNRTAAPSTGLVHGVPAAMALRLASAPSEAPDEEASKRLAEIRSEVAGISLMNLSPRRIDAGTTAGFVATMLKMEPASTAGDVRAALQSAEAQLGLEGRLSAVWAGSG